jgi:hypothetical protein
MQTVDEAACLKVRRILKGLDEDTFGVIDTLRIPNEGEPLYIKGKFKGYTVSSNAHGARRTNDSHEAHVFAFKRSMLTLPYFAQCGQAIWWHAHKGTHKCKCKDCTTHAAPVHIPTHAAPVHIPTHFPTFCIPFGTLSTKHKLPKVQPYGKVGTYKGQQAVVGTQYIKHNITRSEPNIVDAQQCDAPNYKLGIDGTKHTFTTTRKYWIHTKQANILVDNHTHFTPKKQRIAECTFQKIQKYLRANLQLTPEVQPPVPADIHDRQNTWLEGEEEHEKSIPFEERNTDVLRIPQTILQPITPQQFSNCLKRKRCMDAHECNMKKAKFF